MGYNTNSFNSKPWAPQPMKPKTNTQKNNTSRIPMNGKQRFAQSMAMNAPGSDMPFNVLNLKRTENDALAYSTTGKALLDLHYQLSSLRGKEELEITNMFRRAFMETPVLAMRWLFWACDVREGAGERRTFQIIIKDIIRSGGSQMVANLVPLIPEYSRWDMLYTLLEVTDQRVYEAVAKLIKKQWKKDFSNASNSQPISLMAKWLKSANSHNVETRRLGLNTAKILGLTEKEYRKGLSTLRDYLEVVETRMSSDNWQAIDYEKVPSKANLIYNKAFLRHDGERRNMYLDALTNGKAKVNSSVAFPYEIMHKMASCARWDEKNISLFNSMWKSLPDLLGDDYNDTLVVCDDSGSMNCTISNTTVTARTVAFALSIYMAERNKGAFRDMVMTFSQKPQLRHISPNLTPYEKYWFMYNHSEVANTNIEAVFNLILNTAVQNGYSQKDLPSRLLILSDGEWDNMTRSGISYNTYMCPNMTLFKEIEQRYKRNGYTMPKLVFWNLANRSATMPFNENESFPCTLVSGFSVNTFKMVLSDKTNPWDALADQLMVKRYDAVEEAIVKTNNKNNFITASGKVSHKKSTSKTLSKKTVTYKKVTNRKVPSRKIFT